MKIGICAEFIGMKSGGTESYIFNLIKALMEIDKENRYNLYVIKKNVLNDIEIPYNFFPCQIGLYNPWIRNLILMPSMLLWKPIDILHIQNVIPPFYKGLVVATIHDISFEIYPDTFKPSVRYRLSALCKRSAKKADIIITGSKSTKNDLVNLYNIDPNKIEITPYAHNPAFKLINNREKIDEIKSKYGIVGQFILYVGAIQPRKNIIGLINSFNLLKEKYNTKCKLVIVGKKAWLFSEIIKSIKESKYSEDIIYTDYVKDKELPIIMNAAELFVYPSLYEGFGLAVLEAMACGVPVICSNVSSLPEVVGDSAILINPDNREEIAEAMHKVISDRELSESMKKKGLLQSEKFSWKLTAKRTLKVYEKIIKNPSLSSM